MDPLFLAERKAAGSAMLPAVKTFFNGSGETAYSVIVTVEPSAMVATI